MTGQADNVEALMACPDVTCRQAGHCCYPDYGLCGVRRTDRVAAATVPAPPHSPTSRGDQPTMTDHTTDQTDAVEALALALYADAELGPGYMLLADCQHLARRFLASPWLAAEVARRVDAAEAFGQRVVSDMAEMEESVEAEVTRRVDEALAEVERRIEVRMAAADKVRSVHERIGAALDICRDYREEVRHG